MSLAAAGIRRLRFRIPIQSWTKPGARWDVLGGQRQMRLDPVSCGDRPFRPSLTLDPAPRHDPMPVVQELAALACIVRHGPPFPGGGKKERGLQPLTGESGTHRMATVDAPCPLCLAFILSLVSIRDRFMFHPGHNTLKYCSRSSWWLLSEDTETSEVRQWGAAHIESKQLYVKQTSCEGAREQNGARECRSGWLC